MYGPGYPFTPQRLSHTGHVQTLNTVCRLPVRIIKHQSSTSYNTNNVKYAHMKLLALSYPQVYAQDK